MRIPTLFEHKNHRMRRISTCRHSVISVDVLFQVKAERNAAASSVDEMERQTVEFLAERDTEEVTTVSETMTINHEISETVTRKKHSK